MASRMSPDDLGKQYNQIVDKYEQTRSTSTFGMKYLDRFISFLPVAPIVLDIGCGPGVPITQQLVAKGAKVLALDISERMLERARINVPDAAYEQADITQWTASTRFDGIIAWDSLFHLPLQSQLPTLQKILSWLNPEGIALFTAGGQRGEIVSEMFGKEFYYSSLSSTEYKDIIKKAACRLLFDEIDDPDSHGHRVICCKKTV